MTTEAQTATERYALRRALAKRGGSANGWRWIKRPTVDERAAFCAFHKIITAGGNR